MFYLKASVGSLFSVVVKEEKRAAMCAVTGNTSTTGEKNIVRFPLSLSYQPIVASMAMDGVRRADPKRNEVVV